MSDVRYRNLRDTSVYKKLSSTHKLTVYGYTHPRVDVREMSSFERSVNYELAAYLPVFSKTTHKLGLTPSPLYKSRVVTKDILRNKTTLSAKSSLKSKDRKYLDSQEVILTRNEVRELYVTVQKLIRRLILVLKQPNVSDEKDVSSWLELLKKFNQELGLLVRTKEILTFVLFLPKSLL